MARIRTIKPEFWSSPGLPEDPWVRLLFIAMWNWADDYGIGSANERELLGFAFPNDDQIDSEDIRRMLASVRRAFDVKFYTVAGRRYYAIPSWEDHQKIDRRSTPRYPGPDEAETWLYQDPPESPRGLVESPPSSQRTLDGDQASEVGNRKLEIGTEEVGKETCATALRDAPDSFANFWAAYPIHRDRRNAEKAFKNAVKRADPDLIIAGAHRYATDPNRNIQYTKYAQGWLNADGWLDEPLPPRNNGNHVHVATSDLRVAQVQALKNRPERLEIEP